MITKEEAHKIVKEYLEEKEREVLELCSIDDVFLKENKEVGYGDKKGEIDDQWIVFYYMPWGIEEKAVYVNISATTGEVYGSMGAHNWLEDLEENN